MWCRIVLGIAALGTPVALFLTGWRFTHTASEVTLSFVASAVDQRQGRVFLMDRTYGLLVLDSRTGRLLHAGFRPPGQGEGAILVDNRVGRAFVAVATAAYTGIHTGLTALSVVDTRTFQVLHTSTLGIGPTHLALDVHTSRLIAVNQGDDTASIVDARNGIVLQVVPVVAWPTSIVIDTHLGLAFILGTTPDHQMHALDVIDTRAGTVVRTLHHVGQPTGSLIAAAIDEATHHLFVANNGSVLGVTNSTPRPSLEMLDARTGRPLRTITTNPRALGVDTRLARLFVTDEPCTIRIVDTRMGAVIRNVSLPNSQGTSSVQVIAVDTWAHHVFVAGYVPGGTLLDARTGRVLKPAQLSNGTTQLVVDEHAGRIVAAGDYGVGVLDSRTGVVVRTLTPDDIIRFVTHR